MNSGEPLDALWAETELGRFHVATTQHGLAWICLEEQRAEQELARFAARFDLTLREDAGDCGATVVRQLHEYARGTRRVFDVPLDLRGTDFQQAVWEQLLLIPYGVTRTYGEVARALGQPGASRAVGAANGKNPVPIVVPCHRVVSGTGLGGFSGGLDNKRQLLVREGVLLPVGP